MRWPLDAILAEWTSSDSYLTRIGRLGGTQSGGLNNGYLLNATTVLDNNAVDTLLGGQASSLDWFISGVRDSVKKNNSKEIITVI